MSERKVYTEGCNLLFFFSFFEAFVIFIYLFGRCRCPPPRPFPVAVVWSCVGVCSGRLDGFLRIRGAWNYTGCLAADREKRTLRVHTSDRYIIYRYVIYYRSSRSPISRPCNQPS